jgi:3-phosphoshikimate 1-carboxyvinyltransferase
MNWIIEPLRRSGAQISDGGEAGRLPVCIRGARLGPIFHRVEVASAQPVSALLFAALQSSGESVIERRVKARDHTERLLRHLGVSLEETESAVRLLPPEGLPAFDLSLPGDISAAALPIACVVASPLTKRLVIENVGINETRIGFLRVLQSMGANIEIEGLGMQGGEPMGRIVVQSGKQLRGVEVRGDALIQSMIDELPLLAAVASRASGRTVVRDAMELKTKDTDRIATTVATLRRFGVRIEPREDGFEIHESDLVCQGKLQLPPDHRVIFAAMALASWLKEPTSMSGWERVSVSMPQCTEVLSQFASTVLNAS